jgi:hypothetical protein
VLLLCAEVKTLAEKYVELIDDAGVILKENDRLRCELEVANGG